MDQIGHHEAGPAFWTLPPAEAFRLVRTSAGGLSSSVAARRLRRYGANSIHPKRTTTDLLLFLSQFKSPITLLLIIAGVLSLTLGEFSDAVIILLIILVSSLLGFWQERGATNAVNELLKMVQVSCAVLRDGKEQELPVEKVVPGDIVVLNAGDVIPADCLLLEAQELYIDEAAFTGETFPVEKKAGLAEGDAPLAKRINSVFMGSHVISGTAKAIVMQTGSATALGDISGRLQARTPETAFEKGIRRFGYLLMEITLVLVFMILAINVLLHKPVLDSILFSLALAVGLTPQLLPAIISINLSVGAREMAKKQVIVKRLSAIENLGSMDILCSDKTGTITQGKVTLKDTLDAAGRHSEKTKRFAWLNAVLQKGFTNPIDEAIRRAIDEPLTAYRLQAEVPYDFIRKRLTIQVQSGNENLVITKGALDNVLSVCNRVEEADGKVYPLVDKHADIRKAYRSLSRSGYRVLGVAYTTGSEQKKFTRADETNMIFLGFISLFDPLKTDVLQTIRDLDDAGVKLKIITGDNALVAASLAQQVNIKEPLIVTGKDLRLMSESALVHQVGRTHIFAEVEPNQKEKIILALKKAGHVVGFLGDGINDAPALHAADVGISVDTAVDVAKEAAEIVLLSHSLQVLTTGIIAGRKTFTNTMKYIFMATSANFGNMFSMAGASLFLPFLPLQPKQILLTNLLTDVPEMAIATDSVDASSLDKPQRWSLSFIQRFMIVFGLISSVFDYLTFGVLLYLVKADQAQFRTGWFTESVISATVIVLVVRTRLPFFKSRPGKWLMLATSLVIAFVLALPYLPFASLLGFEQLPLALYGYIFSLVALYVLCAETAKRWFYRKHRSPRKAG
ncbi:magnesium-translocating P-type ATPase [Flavisolibacter nicotianae]|uniref:magnesium-translocating P-type ATPase n=1 Tax=Flavisolibacter nicotianae TaxID=2364882 RepID=UPI000EB12884|nr:magnesium-translocating P-type ATPase [Flavisolibacter nicotianae]